MYVESILGLLRMTQNSDKAIANLAKMVLGLIEGSREFETRAGLAEAALEAERAKVAELQATIRQLTAGRPVVGPRETLALAG